MHLVMDTLILHELDVSIPATVIEERRPEWIAMVVTARSRSEYVKGIAAFCGMELIEYDSAVVEQDKQTSHWRLRARSSQWLLRQPA